MTSKPLLLLGLLIPFGAIAEELPTPFVDNFDDGDLEGWKPYVDFNESADVVDGVLEIADAPSGTGRVAFALQETQTLEDFMIEVDILPQLEDGEPGRLASHPGLLARFNGTRFSGYGMNIRRSRSTIEVWKYTNGSQSKLRETSFTIPFDKPLHLIFKGVGQDLTVQVLDGDQLVGEIMVSDSAHVSGFSGTILYFPAGETARFDNFESYHPDNPPGEHQSTLVDVIVEVNNTNGGTVDDIGLVEEDGIVTIKATPNEGYHFVRWEGEGIEDVTASETNLTVTGETTIRAIFEKDIPPGSTLMVNPVIDAISIGLEMQPGIGMQVSWTGGGTLQQLDEAAQKMIGVDSVSPLLTDSPRGIFRIEDPWDGERTTEIYVPANYHKDEAMPLVITLHGANPDPDYIEDYFKLAALADNKGFLLAQPDGVTKSPDGADAIGWHFGENVDDTGYLRGLIEAATVELNVDPNRIYLYGHGNGGTAAFRLAAAHSDVIAGVASLGGASNQRFSAAPLEPVHVLQIDLESESTGIIDSWGHVAGHDSQSRDVEKTLDLQDNLPGTDATVVQKTGGSSNIAVELWEIENGIDFDPGNHDDFSSDVIDWLFAHPKPVKEPFTISGSLTVSTMEECPSIVALVEGEPLSEGANVRNFFKEVGTTSGFGNITAEYAFDMTYVTIEGFEEPVPMKAFGRVLMTAVETGDTIYWEQDTIFTPNGPRFTATMLRGTGTIEGLWGRVQGTATLKKEGFSYSASGWWWPGTP